MNEQMVQEWMEGCMDEWMNEQMVQEWMKEPMNGWKDGWMGG